MRLKRRKGATLGLVAVVILVIIVIGVAAFFLTKMLGGGRELANATDSGSLNVAKQAIKNPFFNLATDFDTITANNFAAYGDQPGNKVYLLNYNRMVVVALMVALNAQDEQTYQSAQNAKVIWDKLNLIGQKISADLESQAFMKRFFVSTADANNVKMLGNNNIALKGYQWSWMKNTKSTNVTVAADIAQLYPNLPTNPNNLNSQGPFLQGYVPITVNLPANGVNLVFCGVPVMPGEKPHLVNLGDFNNKKNNPIVGQGSPGFPAETLPPNSYRTDSQSTEIKTSSLMGMVACAIVGALDNTNPMNLENAYILIKNNKSAPGEAAFNPPKYPESEKNDVFGHEISDGVITQGANPSDLFTDQPHQPIWDQWASYNRGRGAMPNLAQSQIDIRKGDGTQPTLNELKTIKYQFGETYERDWQTAKNGSTYIICSWDSYYMPYTPIQRCIDAIPNFQSGFNRPGPGPASWDYGNVNPQNKWTALEQFKLDLLTARGEPSLVGQTSVFAPHNGRLQNPPYNNVNTPYMVTGLKWFDHKGDGKMGVVVPGQGPYNFGIPKSPLDYLQMIDDSNTNSGGATNAAGSACGMTTTLDLITQRCRMIKPGASTSEVKAALSSQILPLASDLYLFYDKASNMLVMSPTPPRSYLGGTTADGAPATAAPAICLTNYNVADYWINSLDESSAPFNSPNPHQGDGGFVFPFGAEPGSNPTGSNNGSSHPADCTDRADFTKSSGFNNLLGVLEFKNYCKDGGTFSQPN